MTDEAQFTDALAHATRELGHDGFHQRLMDMVGSIVSHDSGWIVRYDGASLPDVLHTREIPDSIIQYYLDAEPQIGDPYLCSWRGNVSARIETLADALPMAVDRDFYDRDFMRRAEFTDELVLYLPSFGKSCLSLFFERRDGRFDNLELERLRALFPAMLGLHDAHLRMVFSDLTAACIGTNENAFIVSDRAGVPIYSTAGWRHAEVKMPKLGRAPLCKTTCGCDTCELSTLGLRNVPLDSSHAIAPGGSLIYLANPTETEHTCDEEHVNQVLDKLTPRERDILLLTLEGYSTGAIAQQLSLAKGYIKNCRLRMYKKFNVGSEKKMISVLSPMLKPVIGQVRRLSCARD